MSANIVLQHHLTGIGCARYLGTGGKAITVDMHRGDAATVFSGDVEGRQRRQLQAGLQEAERVQHPATSRGRLLKQVGCQRIAAPVCRGHWCQQIALLVLHLQRRLQQPVVGRQGQQITRAQSQRRLKTTN